MSENPTFQERTQELAALRLLARWYFWRNDFSVPTARANAEIVEIERAMGRLALTAGADFLEEEKRRASAG